MLQNYNNDQEFRQVDGFARSQISSLTNSQIIAVWVERLSDSNHYRVQYLLPDGSIQEIILYYFPGSSTTTISSQQEISPPIKQTTTEVNTTKITITPVVNSSVFNPKWTPKNYTTPTNVTTKNTTTTKIEYYPGITLNPTYDKAVPTDNTDLTPPPDSTPNDTTNKSVTIITNTTTFDPNWKPTVPLPPSFNTTTVNKTTVNTTFIPTVPTTPPLPKNPILTWNNTVIDVSPPTVPTVNTTTVNTTTVTTNITNDYQQVDNSSDEILRIDIWCRQQVSRLAGARIINIWKLIGTNTYRIEYVTADGTILVVLVTRQSNGQLVLGSVTANNSIVNNTTINNNYQVLNDYTNDANFSYVDDYCRRMFKYLSGAKIV